MVSDLPHNYAWPCTILSNEKSSTLHMNIYMNIYIYIYICIYIIYIYIDFHLFDIPYVFDQFISTVPLAFRFATNAFCVEHAALEISSVATSLLQGTHHRRFVFRA